MKGYSDNLAPYVSTKSELMERLKDYHQDSWDTGDIIAFYDTDNKVGVYNKSDFIIKYDKDEHPVMITERVYYKNYSLPKRVRLYMSACKQASNLRPKLGFWFCITFHVHYIDFTHFKQGWNTQ